MKIELIKNNKKDYLDLLLLADEQENMIDKYLDKGDLFVLKDSKTIGVCVVIEKENAQYELKNIAIHPNYQFQGYGQILMKHLFEFYKDTCKTMFVGTGDSPITIGFYRKCGFEKSHILKNFFIDNYDQPIIDNGQQLFDMTYLKRDF